MLIWNEISLYRKKSFYIYTISLYSSIIIIFIHIVTITYIFINLLCIFVIIAITQQKQKIPKPHAHTIPASAQTANNITPTHQNQPIPDIPDKQAQPQNQTTS